MEEDTFLYYVILITFAVIFSFCYIRFIYTYFERKKIVNITGPTPKFPWGNIGDIIWDNVPIFMQFKKFHNKFIKKKCKFGGIYLFLKPAILLTDIKLIEKIPQKPQTFQYFQFCDFGNFSLTQTGTEINFTSELLNYFIKSANFSIFNSQTLNIPEINKILQLGKFRQFTKLLAISYPIFKGFNSNKDTRKLIENSVKYKTKNDEKNDVIQTLINENYELEEIIGLIYNYLRITFQLSLPTILFCLQELSCNVELQEDLKGEILRFQKTEESLKDNINNLIFLNTVFKETLRKYPPVPIYGLSKNDKKNLNFPEDCLVFVPIYGIHHNFELFQNPEMFDPDRFSEENEKFIQSGSYLPFFSGFSNLLETQVKIILCKLLSKYKFSLGKKSEKTVKFDEFSLTLRPKNDLWFIIEEL